MVIVKSFGRRFRIVQAHRSCFAARILIACFATASSLTAVPMIAAPIVVREITYDDGGTVFSAVPTSLPFEFRIYEGGTPIVYASWLENYSPADVGKSFFSPAEVIAGATLGHNSTTAQSVLTVNGSGFHSTPEQWLIALPHDHYISAIERVVDNLVITPIHETRYTVQFTQRVRIWVDRIPEPTTSTLLMIAIVSCVSRRGRGQRRTKAA